MGSVEKVAAYRKRLNCKTIHFVEGNHDKVTRKSQSIFASWSSLSERNARLAASCAWSVATLWPLARQLAG
jgi:calcineurin-like phosphoesterase family protein